MAEGSKVGAAEELEKARAAIAALPAEQIEAALAFLRAREAELAVPSVSKRKTKANLKGDGAIAQGPAVAAGKRGMAAGRDLNIANVKAATDRPSDEALEESYLRHLGELLSCVSLSGIDPAVPSSDPQEKLQLEAVYTALLTQTPRTAKLRDIDYRSNLSALEMLDGHSHLVLLGDPGSGKSTFASFVGLCLAGELLGLPAVSRKILTTPLPGEKARQPWCHRRLLPVHVVLRDFAADDTLPAEGETASAAHLWTFIERGLAAQDLGDYAPLLRKRLHEEGGLVVLDGLDEVPEAERRREQIREAVESFARTYSRCRFLVTSRTYAYQNQGWRLKGFEEAVLAPFGRGQIDLFVERWYAHMAGLGRLKNEDAAGRAAVLRNAIWGSDRLQGLAQRPLLLTLMASLHAWRGGSLPERREELYANAVDLLLDVWERQRMQRDKKGNLKLVQPSLAEWLRTDRDAVRRVLEDLAFGAHSTQAEMVGTADIAQGCLVDALMGLSRGGEANPARLVEYLSQRSGLLMARGVGVYTLPHRTFQEYLAACRLTRDTFPVEVAGLALEDPNRWREVLQLAGAKAARGASSNVWSLAEHLCFSEPKKGAPIEDLWGAHLAGQVVVESANLEAVAKPHQEKLARLRRWHVHLARDERFPPRERELAGETLAQLGDPRPEVMTLARMEFCRVPAGRFLMGSPEEQGYSPDNESPRRELDLAYDYEIGRYPVTVAQFGEYVERSGYRPGDEEALRGPANAPVTRVSWGEALAFCRWLTKTWREEKKLQEGWEVRLPSEAEWEKTGRGVDGRAYPWGESFDANRCNSGETGIGRPSAVGVFSRRGEPIWSRRSERKRVGVDAE